MRGFLTEYRWRIDEKGMVVGALIMIYDHETKGLEEILTNIQHGCKALISSTTHLHLDERNCLEIVAVKGKAKAIQALTGKLMTVKGVKQLKLATLMF